MAGWLWISQLGRLKSSSIQSISSTRALMVHSDLDAIGECLRILTSTIHLLRLYSYHLPEHVSVHVDYIRPGVALSPPLRKRTVKNHPNALRRHSGMPLKRDPLPPYPISKRQSNTTGLEDCGSAITPACIRALYNIPAASGSDNQNALGIYENQNDVYSQDDLNLFFAKYAPQVPQDTHPTYIGIAKYCRPS